VLGLCFFVSVNTYSTFRRSNAHRELFTLLFFCSHSQRVAYGSLLVRGQRLAAARLLRAGDNLFTHIVHRRLIYQTHDHTSTHAQGTVHTAVPCSHSQRVVYGSLLDRGRRLAAARASTTKGGKPKKQNPLNAVDAKSAKSLFHELRKVSLRVEFVFAYS